jgi:hypothetical protein
MATQQQPKTDTPEKKSTKKKGGMKWIYFVIIFMLVGGNGGLWFYNDVVTKEKNAALKRAQEMEELRDKAEADYQVALQELEQIREEMAANGLLTDSLEAELIAVKERLDKVLATRAPSKSQLKEAKDLASRLTKEKESFTAQLDSLKTLTSKLLAETEMLTGDLAKANKKVTRLKSENKTLTAKVDLVNMLRTRDLEVYGIQYKGSGTESPSKKAKKTEDLKITFNIEKNMIVDAGEKVVHISITGPNGILYNKSFGSGRIKLKDSGDKVKYTTKIPFEYKQNDLSGLAGYWKGTQGYEAGTYKVKAFYDGRLAGSVEFILK